MTRTLMTAAVLAATLASVVPVAASADDWRDGDRGGYGYNDNGGRGDWHRGRGDDRYDRERYEHRYNRGYGRGNYAYGGYAYAPAYGYNRYYARPSYQYQYVQPSYGYVQPSYGYAQPSYGYAEQAYGYPQQEVYVEQSYGRGYNGGYYRDGRCHGDRTAGAIIGAIAGGLIGNGLSSRYDNGLGTIVGAGGGALAGSAIARGNC